MEVALLNHLTVYNPSVHQTDSDPLVTASMSVIDTVALATGEVRWMALSRDLLKRWNGALNYNDTIRVVTGDASIDGDWIVKDCMPKRRTLSGDLLFHASARKYGLWKNVRILKRSR